jgi:tripartite-type tricarboxylate transporter receptor subunit TctC
MAAASRLRAVFALTVLAATTVCAQTYPANRPIRVIVPLAAGGGSDIAARLIAPGLTERLGQAIVVDNRPAANGVVGTEQAARAAPDGHTLLLAVNTHAAFPWLYPKLPFDAMKGFVPVTQLVAAPLVATVNMSLPVTNLRDFIAYVRTNGANVNYGSSGTASPPHLAAELFKSMVRTDMTHVVYKGIAPAVIALLSNEVQVLFATVLVAQPHIRGGKLRALGISTLKRTESAPDWPTLSEAGLPGYEAGIWYGVLVPAGTSPAIVDRLHKEITSVLQQPKVRAQIVAQGGEPIGNTPAEFGAVMRADYQSMGKLIREKGIKLE